MRKQYEDVVIKVMIFNSADVVTASGDNFEDDPWSTFEY
jgi:hypothetical protein